MTSPSRSWRGRLGRLASALTPSIARTPKPTLRTPVATKKPARAVVTQDDLAPHVAPESHTPTSMARGLGLSLDLTTREVTRGARTLTLPDTLQLPDLASRATLTAELLAARLFLDHAQCSWTPGLERPDVPADAYQKKDIPSSYGDRLPRIIPTQTRLRLEALLIGETLLWKKFEEGFDVVFVLDVGKHQHLMTHEAASAAHLSIDRIIEDARYTLFYQSYKIKPEREQLAWGKARHYITREGLGATRALMLPDFDFQAAQERGFAVIISRDHLLIVEPLSPAHRDEAKAWCEAIAPTLRAQEKYPYIMELIALELT